ncbi:hypothetical protein NC651_022233 [Populus alba x Populus x berolinensis]|nr:hypothetical protein NC651_022233 [Populus alba x Populus x berolinensis]
MYPNILFNTSLLNLSYQIFTMFLSSYLIYQDFTIMFHGHHIYNVPGFHTCIAQFWNIKVIKHSLFHYDKEISNLTKHQKVAHVSQYS